MKNSILNFSIPPTRWVEDPEQVNSIENNNKTEEEDSKIGQLSGERLYTGKNGNKKCKDRKKLN